MKNETIIILDFGGQYSQLIARRIRECNVYCEVLPFHTAPERVQSYCPKGIILTGGPANVYAEESPRCSADILHIGCPVLGICYGMQLMAYLTEGKVQTGGTENKEYGHTMVTLDRNSLLFKKAFAENSCWMSHTDFVSQVGKGFCVTAQSKGCPIAAMENAERQLYGVQFHPEVMHTANGTSMLQAFLYDVCGCAGDWTMSGYVERTVAEMKEKFGDKKVLLALSGGVDSAVAAAMVGKAAGNNLTCIFVDHGMLRKYEREEVEAAFQGRFGIRLITVDARQHFLDKLAGVTDPEKKRKIIGAEFINVFQKEAEKIGEVDYFVQGTIYPDVIESGAVAGSAVIKSHHNVGGLPSVVKFKEIVEPLRNLFKDEVRKCGFELGLPENIVMRQPFPGPGLAIRVIGDITEEKLEILREADYVFRDEVAKSGIAQDLNQYFAVLTGMRSVGVMGDGRTYDYTIALRAVTTTDFMTADWARIPYDLLQRTSTRIVNEVGHVNRVLYDITSKPPATIEWE